MKAILDFTSLTTDQLTKYRKDMAIRYTWNFQQWAILDEAWRGGSDNKYFRFLSDAKKLKIRERMRNYEAAMMENKKAIETISRILKLKSHEQNSKRTRQRTGRHPKPKRTHRINDLD